MLEILGTIGSNVLSLPGILGFAFGMMTRNIVVAAVLGGLIGLLEALIFAGFSLSVVGTGEGLASIGIGVFAAMLGSLFRRKGAAI